MSEQGGRSQTQNSFALVVRWEIQPREALEMPQEVLKYGPHIPTIQIHPDGFLGKGFPSARQPQQGRCLTVTLLGDSEPLGISFPSPGTPSFQPGSSQPLRVPTPPHISGMG